MTGRVCGAGSTNSRPSVAALSLCRRGTTRSSKGWPKGGEQGVRVGGREESRSAFLGRSSRAAAGAGVSHLAAEGRRSVMCRSLCGRSADLSQENLVSVRASSRCAGHARLASQDLSKRGVSTAAGLSCSCPTKSRLQGVSRSICGPFGWRAAGAKEAGGLWANESRRRSRRLLGRSGFACSPATNCGRRLGPARYAPGLAVATLGKSATRLSSAS